MKATRLLLPGLTLATLLAATAACTVPTVDGDVLDITGTTDDIIDLGQTADQLIDTTLERTALRTRPLGNLVTAFNDVNDVQLAAGRALGINPLTDTRSFWRVKRPLARIATNPDFVLENLTHSKPYLVTDAANALHEIGRRFNDTLQARGGGNYKIIVTSVLRTPDDIRRLRRVNRNAVVESVHQYATTFDISHRRFAPGQPDANAPVYRRDEDLTALLAEILDDMRAEGRLYVKYEVKQSCFHITVRR